MVVVTNTQGFQVALNKEQVLSIRAVTETEYLVVLPKSYHLLDAVNAGLLSNQLPVYKAEPPPFDPTGWLLLIGFIIAVAMLIKLYYFGG